MHLCPSETDSVRHTQNFDFKGNAFLTFQDLKTYYIYILIRTMVKLRKALQISLLLKTLTKRCEKRLLILW